MTALELVKLTALMERTSGRPEIVIGLIDGPVAVDHADLVCEQLRAVTGVTSSRCSVPNSVSCLHGTFVAGILSAKRRSGAPAIAPDCTLLVRPIFVESAAPSFALPAATPDELAAALIECTDAGARVLNLSVALTQPSTQGLCRLEEALNHAARRGVIVIAAAGNQGIVGSSAITRHPWVIPVAACDQHGWPSGQSNLGNTIGRRGLSAPGEGVASLSTNGGLQTLDGTSVAAPFVTGAAALLWSEFPTVTAVQVKFALLRATARQRTSVVPPLLNAWAAYQTLAQLL
ncbi:MAG: peptidase S8 [Chloroflexi bacterium]|nr:MAG: peptidase S8 [Chloroflexota bacterium]